MHFGFSQSRDFNTDDVIDAIGQLVPLARTAQQQIQQLQEWAALGRVRPASNAMLPRPEGL